MHSEPGLLIIPAAAPCLVPPGSPARCSVMPTRGHAHAFRGKIAHHPSRVRARFAYHPSRAPIPCRLRSRAGIQSQVCLSSQPRPLDWDRGGRAHAFRARFAYHPSRAHWPGTAGGHHASSPGGPPGTARRPPGQGQMHPREEPRACIQSQVCLSSQPRQRQVCLSSQPRPHPLSPEVARMHSEPGLLIIPAASPGLGSRGPRACIQSQVCLSSQPRPLARYRLGRPPVAAACPRGGLAHAFRARCAYRLRCAP